MGQESKLESEKHGELIELGNSNSNDEYMEISCFRMDEVVYCRKSDLSGDGNISSVVSLKTYVLKKKVWN